MVRTALNNPFAPGSDRVPDVWAGRAAELADVRDKLVARRRRGLYERGRVVLGPPGVGKSVLVNRLARELADDGHVVLPPIRVAAGSDTLSLVADALAGAVDARRPLGGGVRRLEALLARVRRLSQPALGTVEVAPPVEANPYTALGDLLAELAGAAWPEHVVVLRIDEVQNVEAQQLSQLLTVVGDALAQEQDVRDAAGTPHQVSLPVAVLLAGLPEFVDLADHVRATFARRFQVVRLGPLEDDEVRAALASFITGWHVATDDGPRVVTMEAGAIDTVVEACGGDPYLFQLVGETAWNAGTGPVVTADEARVAARLVARQAREHVERILERVPPGERAVLDALVELEPDERSASRVAQALGQTSQQVAPTLRRLEITRGLVERGRPIVVTARAVEGLLRGTWPPS